MILYSIIPADIVFDGFDSNKKNDMRLIELEYMGEKIQAIPASNGEYIIARLLSTSPKAYLNPALQPGNVIKV
ncbi:MAG TPA: hypothetical protein GXX36_03155 [Clostridiaceae bacterium]|nr:hypothetical protein [Clostridiaceae bacterium]